MADEEEPLNIEFIPAFEDAKIRLACFDAVASRLESQTAFKHVLDCTKELYAWVMETDNEEQTTTLSGDEECLKRH